MPMTPSVHRHPHQRRVAVQQRVHETRRLLLEAADRLLELDEAARRDDAERAASVHHQAVALVAASTHQLRFLSREVLGEQHTATTPPPLPTS